MVTTLLWFHCIPSSRKTQEPQPLLLLFNKIIGLLSVSVTAGHVY